MDPAKYEGVRRLTCFNCYRIYLKPYQLPCGHVVCQEHLTTNLVVTTNKIVCKKCKNVFEVNGNKLILPKLDLQEALDKQIYLSSYERNFKASLHVDFNNLCLSIVGRSMANKRLIISL